MLKDLQSSYTVFGIPKSHWDCHLHTLENPPPKLEKAVLKFLDEWKSGQLPAPRLLLTGHAGLGKSHTAVGIYRHCVHERGTGECLYVHVPDFCAKVKRGFDRPEEDDPFESIESATLVVLDDLFGLQLTEYEINKILARLISIAYDKNQALVITTNYTLKELATVLHPHELSRLLQNATHVEFASGKDKRLSKK